MNTSFNRTRSALMLTVGQGISGSGKSKFAQLAKDIFVDVEVNADNVRAEFGDVSDQSKNAEVFERVDELVNQNLAGGRSVILSNTNLHYHSMVAYAKKYPYARIIAMIMMDSKNPELCKERIHTDLENGIARSAVPDEVVDKQYVNFNNFLKNMKTKDRLPNMEFYAVDTNFAIRRLDLEGLEVSAKNQSLTNFLN